MASKMRIKNEIKNLTDLSTEYMLFYINKAKNVTKEDFYWFKDLVEKSTKQDKNGKVIKDLKTIRREFAKRFYPNFLIDENGNNVTSFGAKLEKMEYKDRN